MLTMNKITFSLYLFLFSLVSNSQCWKSVSAGGAHTIGITVDGALWSWGRNQVGQLGINTATGTKKIPTRVGDETNWSKISAGNAHNLALKIDGTIWTWGRNLKGQLGNGNLIQSNVPIQVGNENSWAQIAAGDEFCVALKSDGTLWAWGDNQYGQCGDGSNVDKLVPTQIGSLNTWQSIAAGTNHTMVIKTNGTLWGFGYNNSGQLGDGSNIAKNNPTQIGTDTNWKIALCGIFHTVALKTTGKLFTWGDNTEGQLGIGNNVPKNTPQAVEPSSNFSKIAKGHRHNVLLRPDNSLWSCGANVSGQLGDGTVLNRNILTAVSGALTNWASVDSRVFHTAALNSSGNLFMWGSNFNSQFGNNSTVSSSEPISIECPGIFLANETFDADYNFSIYPNPASLVLKIKLVANEIINSIIVTDFSGKKVLIQKGNFNEISIENLAAGMYFLEINATIRNYQTKFLKN